MPAFTQSCVVLNVLLGTQQLCLHSCVVCTGVTRPLQRLPHCLALWAAEACVVLTSPGSAHYALVSRAILQKVLFVLHDPFF